MNRQRLIIPPRGVIEEEIAVTNGNDVVFAWDIDSKDNDLPAGFIVRGIDVIPHDGGDPEVAVSTVWRLRLYKRYTRRVKDLVYEDTRYGQPASDVPGFNSTPWQWENLDVKGIVHGTIGIETGATDCTFAISISFER